MTNVGEQFVQRVLDELENDAPLTTKEVAERLGENRGTVHEAFNRLLKRGEVEREVRVVLGTCGQHPYEYRIVDEAEAEAEDDDRVYDEDGGVIPA